MKAKGIMKGKIIAVILLLTLMLGVLTACGSKKDSSVDASGSAASGNSASGEVSEDSSSDDNSRGNASEGSASTSDDETTATVNHTSSTGGSVITTANVSSDGAIDATGLFTERDLTQTPDLSNAVKLTVESGKDISITEAGTYVITGTSENTAIVVEAADEDKVQIVLDGVSITNEDAPAIYVKNADKVFVTTTESENSLSVTGTFTADGTTNLDAVIFSRDDLILNGLGVLNIVSTDNGISGKDDIKITGGTINIDCTSDAIEANESIIMADGTVNIESYKDGFHAENDEDNTTGYIYICGGDITVNVADDAIHATTIVQIDGGTFNLVGTEAIEATYIQINDGEGYIYAVDDGINASAKSSAYAIAFEMNGGYFTIEMGQGDTDAVDSNGDIYVNGGTLNINAQSPFDYDVYAEKNGGTIIVNGVETDQISNQMMGGHGGPGGGGRP